MPLSGLWSSTFVRNKRRCLSREGAFHIFPLVATRRQEVLMADTKGKDQASNLGLFIKQQRILRGLTLGELGALSRVSPSHLGRIERGERFPSASVLRRIAGSLELNEGE